MINPMANSICYSVKQKLYKNLINLLLHKFKKIRFIDLRSCLYINTHTHTCAHTYWERGREREKEREDELKWENKVLWVWENKVRAYAVNPTVGLQNSAMPIEVLKYPEHQTYVRPSVVSILNMNFKSQINWFFWAYNLLCR